jgi:hypothetical protein
MPGNDKVRHCPQCKLDVYNLSEMTPLEINQLVLTANGFSSFSEKNLTVPGHAAVTLQLGILMGEVVVVTEQTSTEIPAALSEPLNVRPDVPSKSQDHRNVLQRFFSKLHRLF